MKRFLGVDFSPLVEPWDRQLTTLGVLLYFTLTLPLAIICSILPFILIFTSYWYILLVYGLWYFYDRKSPQNGGYPSKWVQSWRMNKWFADYFPVSLHKTAEFSTDQNYIIGCHPHGIIGMGFYATFASEGANKSKVFPGIQFLVCTLASNFNIMITRELLQLGGFIDCSKESIRNVLSGKKEGKAVVIVVGGAEEALDAHPSRHKLKLLSRKGFVKEAFHAGASLVPVYSFGENDIYEQVKDFGRIERGHIHTYNLCPDSIFAHRDSNIVENPKGSAVRRLQTWLKEMTGVSLPLFYGRGFFQLNFGFLPHSRPINTVVGAPIAVQQVAEPTNDEVDRVHKQYCDALAELFDRHKTQFGLSKNTKLTIE